jgi:hypothetical protein
MRRRNKKMKQPYQTARSGPTYLFGLIAGGLVMILAGGVVVWASFNAASPLPPEVTGMPKLEVAQSTIDEGYQKYDTPVQTAFRLRNVGDYPLKILAEPQVVLIEGC